MNPNEQHSQVTPLAVQPQPTASAQPQPANPAPAAAPYMRSQVSHIAGRTTLSPHYAGMLEWGADNRIRFYYIDAAGNPLQTLFDVAPQEIKKFIVTPGVGTVKLHNGTQYYLEFDGSMRGVWSGSTAASTLGIFGMIAGYFAVKKSAESPKEQEILWWKSNLARYGVGGGNNGMKSELLFNKILYGVFAVVAVFLLLLYLTR